MENYSLEDLLDLGGRVGSGKTSSDSVSLNEKIKEAQAVDEMDRNRKSSTKPAMSRAEMVARAKADTAQRSSDREATQKKYGTADTAKVNAVEGQGPFNANFDQLAAGDPLRATQQLDSVEKTLGLSGGAASADAPMYRGTQKASDGSGEDIPYYTNIPGTPEGTSNLERYQPRGESKGLGGDVADNPRMRAVAEKIRADREQVQYGPRTPDAIAKEVAGRLPGAVNDIKTLGNEAASAKWLGDVQSGALSDAAYKRIHVEAADEAKRQDDAEYEKVRDAATATARTDGVTTALADLRNNRLGAKGNPEHMKRIEAELRMRARPATSPDMLFTPDLYLPASKADAATILGKNPGTAVDVKAPPTLLNPHGGKTAGEVADDGATQSIASLIGSVGQPGAVGSPAKTASSYTNEPAKPLNLAVKGLKPQKQSQNVGGAELGYEIGSNPLPSADDAMAWLEGGGDIARGRKTRARKATGRP